MATVTALTAARANTAVASAAITNGNLILTKLDGSTVTVGAVGGSGGGLTQEQIEDIVSTMLTSATGGNVTVTYVDNGTNPGTLVLTAPGSGSGFTQEQIEDIVAAMFVGNAGVSYTDNGTAVGTITLPTTSGGGSSSSSESPYYWHGALWDRATQMPSGLTEVYSIFAAFDYTLEEVMCTLETSASSGLYAMQCVLRKNGTTIATVTIDLNGTLASTTTISTPNIVKGDELSFLVGSSAAARGGQVHLLGRRIFAPAPNAAPATPPQPSVSRTAGNILVNYTPVSGATSHRIDYSTDNGITWVSGTTTTSGASVNFNSLVLGTSYIFSVLAFNGSTASTRSTSSQAITFANVPSAASLNGVLAANASAQMNILAASSNNGATITGYKILGRTPSGSGTYLATNIVNSPSGQVTVTTLNGSSLVNNTAYEFVVVTMNALGDSAISGSVVVTPSSTAQPPSQPGIPQDAINYALLDGTATLQWTAATNAVTYNLRYKRQFTTDGYITITGILANQNTGYSFNGGVMLETEYVFSVAGVNQAGTGPWSEDSSLNNILSSPLPTPVVGAVPGNASVALSWPAVSGATSYIVYHRTNPLGDWVLLTTTSSLSFNHTGVQNGVTQRYLVFAKSTTNASAPGIATAIPN
jgi:hypothetical protein